MIHLPWDLIGLVDLDFDIPPCCQAAQSLLSNSHQPKSTQHRSWSRWITLYTRMPFFLSNMLCHVMAPLQGLRVIWVTCCLKGAASPDRQTADSRNLALISLKDPVVIPRQIVADSPNHLAGNLWNLVVADRLNVRAWVPFQLAKKPLEKSLEKPLENQIWFCKFLVFSHQAILRGFLANWIGTLSYRKMSSPSGH